MREVLRVIEYFETVLMVTTRYTKIIELHTRMDTFILYMYAIKHIENES